jgi:hypothetical protein
VTAAGLLLTLALSLDGGAADAAPAADARDGGAAVDAAAPADAAAPDGGSPDARADGASVARVPVAPPTGRLAGRVVAKGSRKAVAGASLAVDVTDIGETDARGEFSVDVPCGPRRLSVQAPGFELLSATVDACAGAPEPLVLRLVPSSGDRAYETVIRKKTAHPAVRLTDQELTQTPGSLGDPLRVIESLPGVSSVAWPAPVYAVRGSNPGNTGFFLDGVRMPALFHMALGPSVIHPYFLRDLEFYPGGYPARFGRYAAGVVSAETRAAETDARHASVDVRLFDAGGMVTAPMAGGSVAAAARYSYTGELISLLNESIRLSYWDYQLRADRRVGPVQLTLFVFGSSDALESKGDAVKELDLGFHRVSLRAAIPVAGGRVQGSVTLGTDHSRAPVGDLYPIVVDAKNVAPQLSYGRSFGPADLAIGFDGEIGRYEPVLIGPFQPTGDWDLARRRNAYLLAGYASATLRAGGGRLTLTPELRYDTYQVSGAFARDLAPRLSGRLALRDDTAIQIAGGHFTQMPSLPLQIPGAEAFGLHLLGLQTSWQGSVGVETTAVPATTLAVTGYLQHYQLTELRDPTLTQIDTVASDLLVRREAVAYGVEVMARRPLTHRLYGWLSYTLSNSLRSYGGGAVGPSDWDQRHVLNLVAGYRAGRNTFGARFHVNTGRPIVLNDGVKRLPTFYQLDLRADHVVYYDKVTLNLYAELVNATATEDVTSYSEQTTGQVQQSSYRIVLPSIGMRAEY